MGNFYTDVIARDKRVNTIERVSDLMLLEPIFRNKVISIIDDAKSEGLELMVFETFRSKVRQQHLFASGATKLSQIGVHHFGLACDLVRSVNGRPSWEGDFTLLGELSILNGLLWGGDWGQPNQPNDFVDAVHIQWCSIRKQEHLFALEWYPPEGYDAFKDI
jgi:hypothetical protein